jgi:broad specificity phosphatase PhoE
MTTRLVLLCAGGTASARAGGFPDPAEPLDEGGRAKAAALALVGPAADRCWTSPARAACETAELVGVTAAIESALRDIDHGEWTGRAFGDIDPAALTAWLAAPDQATPGGEAMAALVERVGRWLDTVGEEGGAALAISHAAVIRAALAHALGLPAAATLAIDVAPLSATVLSHHGRWRLQELRRA